MDLEVWSSRLKALPFGHVLIRHKPNCARTSMRSLHSSASTVFTGQNSRRFSRTVPSAESGAAVSLPSFPKPFLSGLRFSRHLCQHLLTD